MRLLILAAIVVAGCGGTVKHEVTIKLEGGGIFAPRHDLTDSQNKAFRRDMAANSKLILGIIGKGMETPGDDGGDCIRRVCELQDRYDELLKQDHPNAGKWLASQLQGKSVQSLANEYRANHH